MKFDFLPRIRRHNTNTQEKFLLGAILRERYGKAERPEVYENYLKVSKVKPSLRVTLAKEKKLN